jgi:hypothetical protein
MRVRLSLYKHGPEFQFFVMKRVITMAHAPSLPEEVQLQPNKDVGLGTVYTC